MLLAAAAVSFSSAAVLAWRSNRIAWSLTGGLAAILLAGLLTALAHRDAFPESDLRFKLAQGSFPLNVPVSFQGCVIEESARRGEESAATIEVTSHLQGGRWTAVQGKAILRIAEAREPDSVPSVVLNRGDGIRAWAVWQLPRNYENPGSADRAGVLARRGIYILGRTKSARLLEVFPGDCSNPWSRFAAAARSRVRESLRPLAKSGSSQPAAVLASLVIGDYSGLSSATREAFQNTGTYHVLVVSGLHVAWIAGVLLQLLRLACLPERIRHLTAAFAILLYTCVVGFQASITRCLWMFLLYLLGRVLLRRADAINILLASALILLAAQPDWLFETGFQLSFLSVLAIALTAAPAIERRWKPLWEPLMHSGEPERLFLEPGAWHRRGRWLRTRCELWAEGLTDRTRPFAGAAMLRICRWTGAGGFAAGSMVLASVSVQLWLEPVLALNFNRLSWIGPAANLVMVPFSSIVLAAGIVASACAGLAWIGPCTRSAAGALATTLLNQADRFASIPGAWQRCPTPSPFWILAGILLLFIWSLFECRRFWIPCTFAAALTACVAACWAPFAGAPLHIGNFLYDSRADKTLDANAAALRFTFLDVGEGDSIVIRFPDGRTWLLDAGGLRIPPSVEDGANSFDIGEAVVSRYLWHFWITKLDRLIISHPDQDHAGGIPAVIENFRVARLDHAAAGPNLILDGIMKAAQRKRVRTTRMSAGAEECVGRVRLRVLNPLPDSVSRAPNDQSLVYQFSYGRFAALLTGDLEKPGERRLLARIEDLESPLLKVSHHGSRSATSDMFLDRVRPRWAVISVGRNNPFGHPSAEVLARLRQRGTRVYLTLDQGAITLATDGLRYEIGSHRGGVLERGLL
jgi:competence protein ComEC